MNKLNILFRLGAKFTKKYFVCYLKLMLIPVCIAIIGFLSVIPVILNPSVLTLILALVVSLSCIFYSFWKGFLITYGLNILALGFIKNNPSKNLKECYLVIKKDENDFAKYIGFFAAVTIISFLPSIFYFFHLIPFSVMASVAENPFALVDNVEKLNSSTLFCVINAVVVCPFLNYATQAYLFKRENEGCMRLLFNCFKYLDTTGLMLALIITVISFLITNFLPLIYLLSFMVINVFVYSVNTFWYYSRTNKNI